MDNPLVGLGIITPKPIKSQLITGALIVFKASYLKINQSKSKA